MVFASLKLPRLCVLSAWVLMGLVLTRNASAETKLPDARVIGVDAALVAEAKSHAVGHKRAHWSALVLASVRRESTVDTAPILDAFMDGEFGACVEAAKRPELGVYRLLGASNRSAASSVAMTEAQCWAKMGQMSAARERIERILQLGLDLPSAMQNVQSPVVLGLIDSERAVQAGQALHKIRISSNPKGAKVEVDGGALRCDATPCVVSLKTGEHLFRAGHLGQIVSTRIEITTQRSLSLQLGEPSRDAARAELARRMVRGELERARGFQRLANIAMAAPISLFVWRHPDGVMVTLYDRRSGKTFPSSASSMEAAIAMVHTLWKPRIPTPWYRTKAAWLTTGGVAIVAAGVASFLLYEQPRNFEVRF